MTRKEKELVRLEIQRERYMTEAIMAFQYKDDERSLRAQYNAGRISGEMAKVRREGVRLSSRVKEEEFIKKLNSYYPESEDLYGNC